MLGRQLQRAKELLEEAGELVEAAHFAFRETGERLCQQFDPSGAGALHQLYSFRSSFETDAAGVLSCVAANQAGTLQAGDDAAHGRWADLFGIGELAERARSRKDQDGKG